MNDLPGKLIYVFVVSILDAALLAWLALRWYRRSVHRLMRGVAVGPASPPAEAREGPVPATPPSGSGGFQLAEEQGDASAEQTFAWRAASRRVIICVLSWGSRVRLDHHHAEVPARIAAAAAGSLARRLVDTDVADSADARRAARAGSSADPAARAVLCRRRGVGHRALHRKQPAPAATT